MKKILFTTAVVSFFAINSYAQNATSEITEETDVQVEFMQVEKCIKFENGTGDYDKNCFNAGLLDMEEGKCYTFNKERGAVPVWINNYASQSWWWSETECFENVPVENPSSSSSIEESSSSIEESSISEEVVPAKEFMLVEKCIKYEHGKGEYTKNCYNSGLNRMEEGACYVFNPSKSKQYENEKYVNSTASDTAWWVKADCYDTIFVEPSDTVEVPSDTTEVPSDTVDVPSDTTEVPSDTVDVPSDTTEVPSDTVDVPSDTTEVPSDTVEVPSDTTEVPSDTIDVPSDTTEVPSDTVEVPSDTTEVPSDTIDVPSDTTEVPSDTVEVPSDTTEVPSDTVEVPSDTTETPVEPTVELIERCITFINGVQNYGSACFNKGLNNMENGKCYTMNPAREGQYYTYINNDASDSWWWIETSCFDSIRVEIPSDTIDVPSDTTEVPSDTVEVPSDTTETPVEPTVELIERCITFINGVQNYGSACFNKGLNNMENGKCYTMNPSREGQYYTYINNDASDSWWWIETSCFEDKAPKASPKAPMFDISKNVMNLSKHTLHVASSSSALKMLQVFDINGKLLHSESISSMVKDVDFAKFAGKGAIIVRMTEGNKIVAMKRMTIR